MDSVGSLNLLFEHLKKSPLYVCVSLGSGSLGWVLKNVEGEAEDGKRSSPAFLPPLPTWNAHVIGAYKLYRM